MSNEAKHDGEKPQIHLVPMAIVPAIARIREYGTEKYKDPENWKKVEPIRYYDAMMRHAMAIKDDLTKLDEESGLPHLWHIACNVAFMIEQTSEKRLMTAKEAYEAGKYLAEGIKEGIKTAKESELKRAHDVLEGIMISQYGAMYKQPLLDAIQDECPSDYGINVDEECVDCTNGCSCEECWASEVE